MKIKLFKKEDSFKKENLVFNPNLYWEIVLFIAFVLIIVASFFGYNLFSKINQELVLPILEVDEKIPTVKKEELKKILQYFSEKKQKSNEIINSPSPIVDPSL